eukprot:m.107749 g.107749  ORF g.107749 m.107749 type:complete len:963 (+) comp9180_c0_seq1:308-3196(+)
MIFTRAVVGCVIRPITRTLITPSRGPRVTAVFSPLHTVQRNASIGIIGSLLLMSRRVVLYPALVVGGIGMAADKAKEAFEWELPPGVDELATGVSSLFGLLGNELKYAREAMTPNTVLAQADVVKNSKAVEGGPNNNQNNNNNSNELGGGSGNNEPSETDIFINKLQKALNLSEEKVKDLKMEVKRLQEEHETEMAILNNRLAEVEKQLTEANDVSQRKLIAERERLQDIIDRLTTENEEINRLHIIRSQKSAAQDTDKRAIDIFSDILSLRSLADSSFNANEHLPRVVVVGDQSAGKTSVLEMLVRARIFPRGAGSMMTRSPIQVTVSEGQHHVCNFHNEETVYNLRSEKDLRNLRDQIEKRMMDTLVGGNVVSSQTISLELHGPGLQPMVLVDLPGVIQHHTRGMPATTKGSILDICKRHIENPNAIILCIQDASRDAEASSVADLVRTADPEGDRTVFVLTKVDLAEKLGIPHDKLVSTLEGRRFNMHARSYFAVVTGTANPNDSLDVIRKTERHYFQHSELFGKSSALSEERLGVENLSRAVSDIFWERITQTIASERMRIERALKHKETEWKNNYPNQARLSRDDLFNMGRHQILQNVTAFSDTMTPSQWEAVLTEQIWTRIRDFIIDEIYINSAADSLLPEFKTRVENLLDSWVNNELPRLSVNAARDTLMGEFMKVLNIDDPDEVFSDLIHEVKGKSASDFQWNPNSVTKIRSVQELMLRDNVVQSASNWDNAIKFMQHILERELTETHVELERRRGPSSTMQWLTWTALTKQQRVSSAIMKEVEPAFSSKHAKASATLSPDDTQAVQLSVRRKHGLIVDEDVISSTYHLMYKRTFLDSALKSSNYCKTRFNSPEASCKGTANGLHCSDVVLFWRLHNMIRATVNMLRLEAMDYKTEIQEDIRKVLNTIDVDPEKKRELIKGKRVHLSEEIEVLRLLQGKVDDFVKQMKKEGRMR